VRAQHVRRHKACNEFQDVMPARAADALLPNVRYPHLALLERTWELRHNLGVHDGVYVALAEMLEAPLVTCDRRISRAPGHDTTVEVFA
jgi:predicted nucleic acid-binding protein